MRALYWFYNRALALDHALDRTLNPLHALQGGEILFFDLNITNLVQFTEIFAWFGDWEKIQARQPKLAAYCRALHPALAAHLNKLPAPDAPKAAWEAFHEELRALAVEHHDIGHRWELSYEQSKRAVQYLQGNQLLLECLEVAYVDDREGVLAKVLIVD